MEVKLIITDTETGRTFEFWPTSDETRIGRGVHQNNIVLEDAQVSRQHAMIKRDGQNMTLVDPGSANGTLINGCRIKEHQLKDGDQFSIGKYNLQFKTQDPSAVSGQV
jgi:pSer/pThr/pTyr-binding forkhead associated (FHA) protein